MEYKKIESRSNPLVCELAKLRMKKYRDRSRMFLFEGEKLFEEARYHSLPLYRVLFKESYYKRNRARCEASVLHMPEETVLILSDPIFDKLCEENAPQGVLCVARYIDKFEKSYIIDMEEKRTHNDYRGISSVLLLDNIRDPGNLGAIIRSACAFGTELILLSRGCADVYSEKTVRGTMGALFHQNLMINADLKEEIQLLRKAGKKIYAAALHQEAVSVLSLNLREDVGFVIGNEGRGIEDDVIAACDGSVIIPMKPDSESLNAAVAASLLSWEMQRARILK